MKVLKLIKTFFTTIFLFFVLVVGSLVYVSGQSDIYGWRMLIVKSGSMEPTIKTGSIVFIKKQEKYGKNDVVTFNNREGDQTSLITHRIIEVKTVEDKEVLVTKGDFNQIEDKDTIGQENIVGKYHFNIPYIGHLIAFAKTQVGVILLVVVPGTIIIYDELQNIRKAVSEYFAGRKHSKSLTEKTKEESKVTKDE